MLENLKDAPDQAGGWYGRARRFMADVRAELGRVTWPTGREVRATTIVVILTSMLFGVYLYSVDVVFSTLVAWLFQRLGG
jgi:preprotein translocase subunit SecE